MSRTPLRPKDWLHDRIAGRHEDPNIYDRGWEPQLVRRPTIETPLSQACTYEQTQSPIYRAWCDEMRQPHLVHRKQWEWVYILRCLHLGGMLEDGRSGVGFGVGTEPITACAAKRGARVLATDNAFGDAAGSGWVDTNQHAQDLSSLNNSEICDPEQLASLVDFRVVDMRDVPDDITGFDFAWSACALEHLGTLDAGFDFIRRSLDCLKPGGTAVHTTEYNVSSNDTTIERGGTVLYRRHDIERFAKSLRNDGNTVRVTFGLGEAQQDRHIDERPYGNCHLKVRYESYVITSFGLTVTKSTTS